MKLRLIKKNYSIEDWLVYFLGLTSTFQVITPMGNTVFTWLLMIVGILLISKNKKIKIKSQWFIAYFVSLLISLLVNIVFIPDTYLSNKSAWTKASVKGVILLIILFLSYEYLCDNSGWKKKAFFKGLYHSCVIQLIWCYLQFIVYHLTDVNINDILFVNILHMWDGSLTQTKHGTMIITGLHTNAGLLAPVLIFIFIFAKIKWLKILSLGMSFIAGNSSLILCGIAMICVNFFSVIVRRKYEKVNKGVIIYLLLFVILILIIIAANPSLVIRISNSIRLLIDRLISIKSRRWVDGSTLVHTRYYTSIPYIISNIPLINTLFGFGLKCGGIPFVVYFDQYAEMVYGTESDIISNLYGIGIVGLVIFYSLLVYIAIKGRKIDKKYFEWGLLIIFSGIFYSVQLHWVILLEWLMLQGIKNGFSLDKFLIG